LSDKFGAFLETTKFAMITILHGVQMLRNDPNSIAAVMPWLGMKTGVR